MTEMNEHLNQSKTPTEKPDVIEFLQQLPWFVKAIFIGAVLLVVVCIALVITHQKHTNMNDNVTLKSLMPGDPTAQITMVSIPDQLSDVQAKLTLLMTQVSESHDKPDLTALKNTINGLNEELESIKQDERGRYTILMDKINDLSLQLSRNQKQITKSFKNLESVDQRKKCYPASKLPFMVKSIDLINGRTVVSVLYANMVTPLEINFSLAGWKLTTANYTSQVATFVDAKGLCAQSTLTGTLQ